MDPKSKKKRHAPKGNESASEYEVDIETYEDAEKLMEVIRKITAERSKGVEE